MHCSEVPHLCGTASVVKRRCAKSDLKHNSKSLGLDSEDDNHI